MTRESCECIRQIASSRGAAQQNPEHILRWDFGRVGVAHGEVLESGGHEALREGYLWLLAA